MLDFTAACRGELLADDGIVYVEHLHSGFVAHLPSQRGGPDNVGKQDCPNRRVSRTLQHDGAARIQFAAPHEQIGDAWFDLNNFFRDQAMGFAIGPALLQQLRSLRPSDLQLTTLHETVVLADEVDNRQVERWCRDQTSRGMPVQFLSL